MQPTQVPVRVPAYGPGREAGPTGSAGVWLLTALAEVLTIHVFPQLAVCKCGAAFGSSEQYICSNVCFPIVELFWSESVSALKPISIQKNIYFCPLQGVI